MAKKYRVEIEKVKRYRGHFIYTENEDCVDPTRNPHLMGRISTYAHHNENGIFWEVVRDKTDYIPMGIEPVVDKTPMHGIKPVPDEVQKKVDELFKKKE